MISRFQNKCLQFATWLAGTAVLAAALASPAWAANGTSNVNANGAWTTATYWLASTIADGADSIAFFTFNITANRTVTLGASRTIGNITFTDPTTSSHNLTISGANTLTLDVTAGSPVIDVTQSNRTLTISSLIAGSDGLQKNGPGSLILSGANTYTGATLVSSGTLQIGAGSTTGSLSPSSSLTTNGTLAFSRTGTITQGTNFASVIAGTGGVTKLASGTLVLNGTNTYTGVTAISASGGTLQVTLLANGGSNSSIGASSNAAANLLLGNATTFRYAGSANVTTDRGFTINGTLAGHGATINSSGSGTLSFNNTVALAYGTANQTRTLTLRGTNTGTNTFGRVIANNGSGATGVTKNDAGLWLLDQTNTYTGVTTVSAGTLRASASAGGQAFGNLSAVTTANVASAVLSLNGFSQTIGSLAGGGTTGGHVALGSGTLTTGGNSTSTSYAGVISGNGGLTKTGTGTQTLTGTSTYTGATLISGGTLQIGSAGTTGALSSSSSITNNGTLAFSRTNTITQGTNFASVIAGSGNVTKLSTGTLILNGTNTYTGATTVTAGTLRAGAAAGGQAFGNLSAVTTANVAATVLDLNGFSQTIGSLAGGGATGGNVTLGVGTLTTGGNNTSTSYAGVISGNGGLTKTGTGTQTLTNINTYTGTTTVSAGTLLLSGSGSINSTSAISVLAGATLASNSSTALSVAPTLNGAGLSNRAILGGTGTLNAALTLNNVGDTLSPGNSPGVMGFGVGQSWGSNSYDWELNDWVASVAGTNIDQVQITGSLTLTGAAAGSYVLNVLSLTAGNTPGNVPNFADANSSWTILTTTTGITGFDASYWTISTTGFSSSPAATGTWNVSQSSNNLVLNYVAVPEPSVFVLLACGLIALPLLRAARSRVSSRRA